MPLSIFGQLCQFLGSSIISDITRLSSNKKNSIHMQIVFLPLFVPHKPSGAMAKAMSAKGAQNNQGRKIKFKILEKGGVPLESMLRRSNPRVGGECGRPRCFPCRGEMVWRVRWGGGRLQGRVRQERVHQSGRALGVLGSLRWGKVSAAAAQYPQSPEQTGRQL